MNGKVCMDCASSRAISSMAYCRKKGIMVSLSQGSCELFRDGLARFRKTAFLGFALLPFLPMTTIPEGLNSIAAWIDKVFMICATIIILLLVVFILWLLSQFFGQGRARG